MSTQLAVPGDSPPRRANATGGGFFSLYKSGQGYWTRLGTALGAAAIILFIAWFVFSETSVFTPLTASSRRYGIAAIVAALLAGVAWWVMNGARRAQFLIDTDSEMKKVNWAGWAELIGSTKVVVFFMLLTAMLLFTFDTQFHAFFYGIGVWHIPFAAGAGIATGFLISLVLIAIGVALLRGTGEGASHRTSGTITLAIGLVALAAWVTYTVGSRGATAA